MTGSETSGYQPFPPFAAWASVRVDTGVFDRFAGVLDDLRTRTEPERLDRAVRTATRLAAIDTGAIEGLYEVDRGFTMTVAVEAAAWEAAIDAREPVVRRSFEDALRAYDFVLDLATHRTEISEKAIREIHALICASQAKYRVRTTVGWQEQPLPTGEYKTLPNNPTRTSTGQVHHFALPADTPAEMDRLVRELRSADFQAAHPVQQAAYAHDAFVAVHPFADGNGRVARALASAYLYRRPGVPLVVFADQKDAYIDALEEADAGDPQRFVRFVEDRVEDIIGIVQVATTQTDAPATSVSLAALRETFLSRVGLPLEELVAIAGRIEDAASGELSRQLAALDLPAGIGWRSALAPSTASFEHPYRNARGARQPEFVLRTPGAQVAETVGVGLRTGDTDGPTYLLSTSRLRSLPVDLHEVYPALSSVFSVKLATWADGVVRDLLDRLVAAGRPG